MNKSKQSKVVLITGASSGMGHFTAKELIEQGHIVYGAARRLERMNNLIEAGGHTIQMDITKEEDVKNAVEKIISEQGRIDVLWNNAGFGLYGAVEDVTLEEARYQFEVNVFSLARITQLVVPHMRNQKSGLIINTSSMGGKMYTPMGAWYHATKHALEGWSDCLRLELKQFGIKVVVLQPGAIATEFADVMASSLANRSLGGHYEEMAKSIVDAMTKSLTPETVSSPKVISDTVKKIIGSGNPSTRYLVGKYARPMVFIRQWFGDRVFDKAVMSQVNSMAR